VTATDQQQHVFVPSAPHAGLTPRTCECGEAFISRAHRQARIDELPDKVQAGIARNLGAGLIVLAAYDLVVLTERGGPVARCIKCFQHEMEAQLHTGLMGDYCHQFMHPTRIGRWNMALAHQLVAAYPPASRLDSRWLEVWINNRSNLIAGHIDHIPDGHLDEPVLCDVTYVNALTDDEVPCSVPFRMLLDGHHRAARKLREGQPVYGHVLRPWDHERVYSAEEGAYDPELMGWLSREEAEALPWIRSTGLIDDR
jgi:hypothetical protein